MNSLYLEIRVKREVLKSPYRILTKLVTIRDQI